MPIAAVTQIDAAVVRPRTVKPSLMIAPAPTKPMPVMMPCAMRVGSMITRAAESRGNQCCSYTVTSISRLEATHTSAWVRNPAGRPRWLRSRPISPPAASAAMMRKTISRYSWAMVRV